MREKMMTAIKQRVFNEVWTGAKAQGFARAFDPEEETCSYRGENNLRCNVGLLIPDDRYDSTLEGYTASNPDVFDATRAADYCREANINDFAGRSEVVEFLTRMQDAHDDAYDAKSHERNLRDLAESEGLTVPEAA